MALVSPARRLSEAEYLAIERKVEFKSEFYNGEMFAMSGGTRWHSIITVNTSCELGNALKNSDYVVFGSDLRLKVEATGLITYADVTVAGEGQRFEIDGEELLLNPTLIVEVLSESTERYDRGKKFFHYQKIPSLQEYLLISQDAPRVELFVRQKDGTWLLHMVEGLDKTITSPTLKVTLSFTEVFANVRFEPHPIREQTPKPT